MRRLPVYIVLETSGGMSGEPIEAIKSGIKNIISTLRQDPYALETVYLSIITFDSLARQLVPLTELSMFQMPDIQASGTASLGDALLLLADLEEKEVIKPSSGTQGDFKPYVFLFVNRNPTDDYWRALKNFRKEKFGKIVACTMSPDFDIEILKPITENIISLESADTSILKNIFTWSWVEQPAETGEKTELSGQENTDIDKGASLPPKDYNFMRRLPVYLLLDTSGSMRGEPIESVKVGLESMIASLRQDPFALESVYISIITFDREVKQILPLTELQSLQLPEITTPESGPTHLGEALEVLCKMVDSEVRLSTAEVKGDWMPLLFIMTDGKPSDLQKYNAVIPEVKKRNFGSIIACAAGAKADPAPLRLLTDSVYSLDTTDSATFRQFFKWVSASVSVGNRSVGASDEILLPPPPPEVHTVI